MTQIVRLEPPIWLHTPKGEALAYFLIFYGVEHDDLWKCIQQDTGEWWTWTNDKVRAHKNVTMGRTEINKPERKSAQQLYDEMQAKGII